MEASRPYLFIWDFSKTRSTNFFKSQYTMYKTKNQYRMYTLRKVTKEITWRNFKKKIFFAVKICIKGPEMVSPVG